jgi:uncharacterized membrane protein SpoIIM required for sporulation
MNEVSFLKKNADDWRRIESMLDARREFNPDELSELYIRLTDDLAWAKTFYSRSKTTEYLNMLAARLHQYLYSNKKERRGRLKAFWLNEWPSLMYRHRRNMLYSLAVFSAFTAIGLLSSANDRTFVRAVLGDSYVDMTLDNIKHHDPMAVYKRMNQVDMFLGISFNNIRVAFAAFACGLLLSFGTVYILLTNGVLLGAFHYFCYEHGVLWEALRSIWIHGTLEISSIIVAGGAGLVMGNSILFPGTYTRRASFARGARDGMKIVVGLVPMFLCAGFLEGFVTRHNNMPLPVNIVIIGASLCGVVIYFILFPRSVALSQSATRTESRTMEEAYG